MNPAPPRPASPRQAMPRPRPAKPRHAAHGEGPMVRDPASGKYRRTRLFVLTLGYSRKAVRLLVRRSSAQVLGGRPAVSRPRSSASTTSTTPRPTSTAGSGANRGPGRRRRQERDVVFRGAPPLCRTSRKPTISFAFPNTRPSVTPGTAPPT